MRWFVSRDGIVLGTVDGAPDRMEALRQARQRFGSTATVQSEVSHTIQQREMSDRDWEERQAEIRRVRGR